LEEIVREYTLGMWGGETLGSVYEPSTHAKLESPDAEVRRRGEFEFAVMVQFISARADDLSARLLEKSQYDDWNLCLNDYGLPSLDEIGRLSEEEQEALLEELGLVDERGTEVGDECWKRSRIHADKNEGTALLLQAQHDYYLRVAQDWIRANPDQVVPLPR
jgi:hypothetical protein